MKSYIKILSFVFVMCLGVHSAMAQEKMERKMAKSQSHVAGDEEIAKQQTENLNQLVSLSDDQVSKVHAMYIDLQKRMNSTSTSEIDKTQRIADIKEIKALRDSKLKEILTEEQFTTFLKSERVE